MAVNDALGTRMKMFYEEVPKTKLMRRTPVAIRIGGSYTYQFTPTSIGTVGTCICSCGEKFDFQELG